MVNLVMVRVFFITSGLRLPPRPGIARQWCTFFNDVLARKVIGHLRDDPEACTGCGKECIRCREVYELDFSPAIAGEHKLPSMLPYYIENPREYLPERLPPHDALVVINVHEDLLLVLPELAKAAGARTIIVPQDHPRWVTKWVRERVREDCFRLGLECAFPKPFCALDEDPNRPYTNEFIRYFRIGTPKFEIELGDGIIEKVAVLRSSPCGCTYHVAHRIVGAKVDEHLHELVSKYWHSYPCVASMEMDYELGDTVIHRAGYDLLKAFDEALRRARRPAPATGRPPLATRFPARHRARSV